MSDEEELDPYKLTLEERKARKKFFRALISFMVVWRIVRIVLLSLGSLFLMFWAVVEKFIPYLKKM